MDLPEDIHRGWSRSVRPWRMAVVTVKESIQERRLLSAGPKKPSREFWTQEWRPRAMC
jgi:hypothetical protein